MNSTNSKSAPRLPRKVNVLSPDGTILKMPYKELKQHTDLIIEKNICYGVTHDYPYIEIVEYERKAEAEWAALQELLRKNHDTILKKDEKTGQYKAVQTT